MTFGWRMQEGEVKNDARVPAWVSWVRKPKESSHPVKARACQQQFAPGDCPRFQ